MKFTDIVKDWQMKYDLYKNLEGSLKIKVHNYLFSALTIASTLDELSNGEKVVVNEKSHGVWEYVFEQDKNQHILTISNCPFYGTLYKSTRVHLPLKFFNTGVLLFKNLIKYKFDSE
jgi:hypothetical protein